MSLKLQIKDDNFIIGRENFSIIETFIDFINNFGYGSIEKFHEILLDFKDTKNFTEYKKEISKFSIFYLPLLNPPINPNKLDNWIDDTIEESKYIQDFINHLKQALDICFNLSSNIYKKYNELTLNQKYALCKSVGLIKDCTCSSSLEYNYSMDTTALFTNDIETNYNIINKIPEPTITEYITFNDINSMCLFVFNRLFYQHVILKNCKNCGRLFVADNKREYCNRILETGLTCYQTYTANNFKERKHNEPILREYMNTYRRVQNFFYKNKNLTSEKDKKETFYELRFTYDKINKNPSAYDYKQEFTKYNYESLKKKYL